ncbi:hypothetical protein GWI33_013322 [Rhynchophorus ferrugineus]|uniref:Uncharacterized protein n=1 Tax=Rhynchophorus ferrugineus TaxID=354439 RepID=A0A834I3M9_RHYFE|nr:hypothetical protein GWI33_013322 [Rhynchophorus ferrugineus]
MKLIQASFIFASDVFRIHITYCQAVAAMIISKDLFLLGDQDYLRLPNKDEKRPQGPNMGRSNTAPNHSLLLFRYELTNCKLALEACHDNVLMTESKVSESAFKLS